MITKKLRWKVGEDFIVETGPYPHYATVRDSRRNPICYVGANDGFGVAVAHRIAELLKRHGGNFNS